MIPFKYFEFWDVPRVIMISYHDQDFLLESYFDEAIDDYPDDYAITLVARASKSESGSHHGRCWRKLSGVLSGQFQYEKWCSMKPGGNTWIQSFWINIFRIADTDRRDS